MAILEFRINPKVEIVFNPIYALFIRGESQSLNLVLPYSNATGQSFTNNQVLFTQGVQGTEGYILVKSISNTTINGSGNLTVNITIYPTGTQQNNIILFQIDEADVNINASYNSRPVIQTVIIDNIPNRTPVNLSISDFTASYSDYDADSIASIAIFGDVSSLKYNGSNYVEGTFIDAIDVPNITFTPLDQNAGYEKFNTWKAKDINGNISIT